MKHVGVDGPGTRSDEPDHGRELRRRSAVPEFRREHDLSSDRGEDHRRYRQPPPRSPVAEDGGGSEGSGQHDRQRVVVVPTTEGNEAREGDGEPAVEEQPLGALSRVAPRRADAEDGEGDERSEQLDRGLRVVDLHGRRVGMAHQDGSEVREHEVLAMSVGDEPSGRRGGRQQGDGGEDGRETDGARDRSRRPKIAPHEPQAEPDAFEDDRILDLDRDADERHRHYAPNPPIRPVRMQNQEDRPHHG